MCVSPLSDDGVGSGEAAVADAGELVEAMTSDDVLVEAVVDPGVEVTGVSSSSEAVGDELADSAAAVGLVRWLVENEPWVVPGVCEVVVDAAMADSPFAFVDVDAPLEVPSVEDAAVDVLGPR